MSSAKRVSKRNRKVTTKFGIDEFVEVETRRQSSKASDDSSAQKKPKSGQNEPKLQIVVKRLNLSPVKSLKTDGFSTPMKVRNRRSSSRSSKLSDKSEDKRKSLRTKVIPIEKEVENDENKRKSLRSMSTKKSPKTKSVSKTLRSTEVSVKKVDPKKKSIGSRAQKSVPIKDMLDKALKKLSSNAIPDSLPCRESQFKDIFNYVESKLLEGSGGCMYISGVPGTGKTATVHEVRRKLEANNKYPKFTFIEVNGLKLSDPFQCYVHILQELTGEKKSSYQSADILNDRFSNCDPDNEFVILLVDELDLLRTRKQNILYHLFDWPNRVNSKLIVLTIANSMDLPEKLMINRVSSRLGLTRLPFHPYSYRELEAIVSSRLKGLPQVFDCDALQLICRKVAAVSGDARRALDICRLSVEMAQMADEKTVSMQSVDKALQEIFNSLKLVRIRRAPLQEKLFLQSIVQEFRISGVEECNFIDVYKHHIEMCRFEGHYTPSTVELEQIAYNLHACRLIIVDKSGSHLHKLIRLNISVDDINFALKMDDKS